MVGLVGGGYWGLRHLRTLARLPEVAACIVWDTDADRLRTAVAEIGPAVPADSLEHCLATADACIVATPASTHYEIAHEAISRRIPTLVEKPLCESLPEARRLFALARERDCFLQVGHQYDFNSAMQTVRAMILRGDLGRPLEITAIRSGAPVRTDVDVVLDLSIHDISIAMQLFECRTPDIDVSRETVPASGRAEAVRFTLRYPCGGRFDVASAWAGPRRRLLRVEGAKGVVILDEGLPPDEQLRVSNASGREIGIPASGASPLERQASSFLSRAASAGFCLDQAVSTEALLEIVSRVQARIYPTRPE